MLCYEHGPAVQWPMTTHLLLGNKTQHYRDIYLLILLKRLSDHVVLVATHAIEYTNITEQKSNEMAKTTGKKSSQL